MKTINSQQEEYRAFLKNIREERKESSNVVKFIFEDGSSIAVRPSGTEPKCKFYVEAIAASDEEASTYAVNLFRDFCLHYNINN